jgi:hypothetical protein
MRLLPTLTFAAATLVACLSLPSVAEAQVRCGQMLAKQGDSRGFVIKHCGKPDHIVRLTNRYGAQVGEEWHYYKTGYNAKTTTIVFRGNAVASTREVLD